MYTDIFQIPERNLNAPFLNLKEINLLLQQIKELNAKIDAIKELRDDTQVDVKFVTAYAAYSIFTCTEDVTRPYQYPKPLASNANISMAAVHDGGKTFLTNGSQVVSADDYWPCYTIGSIPRLIRYTGTDPIVGDQMRPNFPTAGKIIKVDSGPLICVSTADTTNEWVWVIHNYNRIMELDGKVKTSAITYGSSGTMEVWSSGSASGIDKTVFFTWLGVSGQTIPVGAKISVAWREDINSGAGGWLITNSNCVAG